MVQTGDRLTGGDIYATIQENSLVEHRMMVPPGARGKVTFLAPAGEYSLEDKVLELEFGDTKKVSRWETPPPPPPPRPPLPNFQAGHRNHDSCPSSACFSANWVIMAMQWGLSA